MDRTPERALKESVSCESIEVPEYQPLIDRHPMRSIRGETSIDSAAPSTSKVPWTLVEANNKYYARIKVLSTICAALEARLGA